MARPTLVDRYLTGPKSHRSLALVGSFFSPSTIEYSPRQLRLPREDELPATMTVPVWAQANRIGG